MTMSDMLLSILVPTTPDRHDCLVKLEGRFFKQMIEMSTTGRLSGFLNGGELVCGFRSETIEFMYYSDDKKISVGEKRRRLYEMANGLYSVQWDSDDSVSENGLALILDAIEKNPDCVTYKELCRMSGEDNKLSNHSLKYDDWADNFDGYDFVRTPYMKDVIKTSIARSVPVPDMRYGEDHAWSRLIKPLLKTEIHIDEFIYIYNYPVNTTPERYGIKT